MNTSFDAQPIFTRAQRDAAIVAAYREHVDKGLKFPAESIAPKFGLVPRTVYRILALSKEKNPEPR